MMPSSYGCKDRTVRESALVQDGWIVLEESMRRIPFLKRIKIPWTDKPPCGYDFRKTDKRCEGCSLR